MGPSSEALSDFNDQIATRDKLKFMFRFFWFLCDQAQSCSGGGAQDQDCHKYIYIYGSSLSVVNLKVYVGQF